MIDFRYFLVTIAAIFLALAVGVVLGAGPLKGQFDAQLRGNVDQLGEEKAELRAENEQLEQAATYRDAFAASVAPDMVREKLSGHRVVLVTLPGADREQVRQLNESLRRAGARVTGTVEVTKKWADPKQRQFIDDLASQLMTDDVQLPEDSTPYDRAGALLAQAVVTKQGGDAERPASSAATILGAFSESGLARAGGDLPWADLALVVTGDTGAVEPPGDGESEAGAEEQAATWVALASALDQAGSGAVLAGDRASAAAPGTIAALRADETARSQLSSVDVAGLPSGRVAIVWALVEQLSGRYGHYGAVGATDGPLPRLPAE